jgi:LysM repeat protein
MLPIVPIALTLGVVGLIAAAASQRAAKKAETAPSLPPLPGSTPTTTLPGITVPAVTLPLPMVTLPVVTPAVTPSPAATAVIQTQQKQAEAAAVQAAPTPKAMTPEQLSRYNDLMRALGGDFADPKDIAAATLYASQLEDAGFPERAKNLRAVAAAAATKVKVPVPAALTTLPADVSTKAARVLALESDPKKIRAFIGQLNASYKGVNGVAELVKLLETKAVSLETVKDQAATADKVAEVLKNETPTASAAQQVLPANLQAALDGALNGIGVLDGKVTGNANQQGIDLAKQTSALLKANGYQTAAEKLDALIQQTQAKMGSTATPTTSTATSGYKYRVVKDDNPYSLAKKYAPLNDANRWKELVRANPQKPVDPKKGNFKTLFANELLSWPAGWTVPGASAVTPATVPVVTPAPIPSNTATPSTSLPATVEVVKAKTYTVKADDYLSKIAKVLINDASRWRELRDANPQKAVDPKTGNFKTLVPGEVLTLPASWNVPSVSGYGQSIIIGTEEHLAPLAASPQGVFLNVRFETRGRRLLAHGYLGAGVDAQLFTVDVDMAPIAVAIAKYHDKLHAQVGCVSCGEDSRAFVAGCIGGDCEGIEVGRRKGAFRKLGRAVKRIAKGKALKKLGTVVRKVKNTLRNPLFKGAMHAAAAIFPPVGAPALAVMKSANMVLDKVDEVKNKVSFVKHRVEDGLKAGRKLAKLANRSKRKARAAMLRKGASAQQAETVARKVASAQVAKVLSKAPGLRKKLVRAVTLKKRLEQAQVSGVFDRLARKAPIVRKLQKIEQQANQGDPRARQFMTVLRLVKAQRERAVARGMNVPRGTIGRL